MRLDLPVLAVPHVQGNSCLYAAQLRTSCRLPGCQEYRGDEDGAEVFESTVACGWYVYTLNTCCLGGG